MKTKRLLLLLLPIIALGSCKKDKNDQPVLDGTYTGKIILARPNIATFTDSVAVTLKAGKFSSIDGNSTITTGGGNFNIIGQNVNFVNTTAFPDYELNNVEYNKVAVLNGIYVYAAKGDSLFISKTDTAKSVFIYKLKKR